MEKIDQLIYASIYREFPETILHIELAAACARSDKRKVNEAMRHCARARLPHIQNRHLQQTLRTMASSLMPVAQLIALNRCLDKMRAELNKQMCADNITLDEAILLMQAETVLMNK